MKRARHDAPPAEPVRREARLPLRSDGTLRLGIVSDTHSKPDARGLEHLRALKPDALLHGGDIGALAVLDALSALAPLFAVRGNIDGLDNDVPDEVVLDLVTAGPEATRQLRLYLTHIALAGPRLRADVGRRAQAAGASLVVCGHSHVPFLGQDRGLTLFNPGSMGPRRFQLPILFGVLEVTAQRISLHHVDCATGQRWSPAGR